MRQFILDRSGSEPTLVQTPTEKIPIYDSESAVTDDLTNLDVGQIVATADETEADTIATLLQRLVPIGTILPYYGESSPSGVWLLCDGSEFDTAQYPDLYRLLGKNTLPDLRQMTLQGVGTNSAGFEGTDDVLTLGEAKENSAQLIQGTVKGMISYSSIEPSTGVFESTATRQSSGLRGDTYGYYWNPLKLDTSLTNRTGETNHGNIFGVSYIIRGK